MHYLREKWRLFTKNPDCNKERKLTKSEIYIEYVYKILTWEDTGNTLMVFLSLNFVFWLIVLFEIRPLGVLFATMLILFLYDAYLETRISSIDQSHRDIVDNMYNGILDMKTIVLSFKNESPFAFCLGATIFFLSLGVSANNISGYLFIYIGLLQIFSVHLLYKILPEKYTTSLGKVLQSLSNNKGALAEEELLPFIANKDFNHDDLDLDSLKTDKTADSASNSLISGIMPSYLDVEDSNDIKEEELIPNQASIGKTAHNHGELSSDSDSEHRDIVFDSADFNSDNSSSEENLHLEGLNMTDLVHKELNKETSNSGIHKILNNLSAVSSLLTGAIKLSVKAKSDGGNDSSDSDFEIINSNDI